MPALPPGNAEEPAKQRIFTGIGIATNMKTMAGLGEAGLDFITLSTSDFLVPDQDDEVFSTKLEAVKDVRPPVLAVNSFIRPAHLKCVGPDANHDEVMEWAETVFRRAEQAGVKFVVFGSNGTRRVPEDWPLEKARGQFVAVLKRMGPAAQKHGVIVALEQLRPAECNFLNHIRDGAEIIRKVGHPNVRLLADLYHMKQSGDTPEDLRAAMDVVVHVEIAEFESRTIPGTADSDFRPFFRVLREAGYSGLVNIEAGKWQAAQIPAAIALIREQEGG
jgi:sugar phosphate isomerase/epimerase